MTPYTVVWHAEARDLLALIWMNGRDRNEVATAADAIDQLLAVDADQQGTAYQQDVRSLTISPLQVYFGIVAADRLVKVVHVHRVLNPLRDSNGENGEHDEHQPH